MFEPLCLAPGSAAVGADPDERRATVRYPWSSDISCHLLTADRHQARWARVRDLGAAGVGLLLTHPFEPGTVLGVELHSLSQGFVRILPAEVVQVTEQSDGSWLVGCAFTRELEPQELEALL